MFAKFGPSLQMAAFLLFTYVCVALAGIDYDHKLLPDVLVLPMLWLGLLLNTLGLYTSLSDAVIGAAAGYGVLWLVFQVFKLLTGKEGMGFGDFKLLACFGAWFGWVVLPNIILLSSVLGTIIGVGMMAFKGVSKEEAIPFWAIYNYRWLANGHVPRSHGCDAVFITASFTRSSLYLMVGAVKLSR